MLQKLLPHWCRDGHSLIAHNASEHKHCPLCRAIDERDQYYRERNEARALLAFVDSNARAAAEKEYAEAGVASSIHGGNVWRFTCTPGQLAARLQDAYTFFDGNMLAAVRHVFIEGGGVGIVDEATARRRLDEAIAAASAGSSQE